jgi:hypothetical protein
MAAVLMEHCLNLIQQGEKESSIPSGAVGFRNGQLVFVPLEDLTALMHPQFRYALLTRIHIAFVLTTLNAQTTFRTMVDVIGTSVQRIGYKKL